MGMNDDWYGLGGTDDKKKENGNGLDDWGLGSSEDSKKSYSEGILDNKTSKKGKSKPDIGYLVPTPKGTDSMDMWGMGIGGLNGSGNNQGGRLKKIVIIGVLALFVLVIGFLIARHFVRSSVTLPPDQTSYAELGNVEKDIKSANVHNLKTYIPNSYLAKEWDYFNKIKVREQFYGRVMSTVTIDAPNYNDLRTSIPVKLTYVDWGRVMNNSRDFDYKKIQQMYKDSGIKKSDYEFHKELTNLFCQYIASLGSLPTKTTDITLQMKYTKVNPKTYGWNLTDDSQIDKLLFSSDEFHSALDVFSGIATGDIGTLKTNPNWVAWNSMYNKLNKQLEGEKKNLYEYNKIVTNNNGTVLNVGKDGSVKQVINLNNSSGKDTQNRKSESSIEAPVVDNPNLNIVTGIQNEINVMKENEPLHTYIEAKGSNDSWKNGNLIPYTWVGAYYLTHDYVGKDGKKQVIKPEVGDGSFQRPLGIGTPIVTKMIGVDKNYHDVRITLTKVFTKQKAIDYAVSFDNRNRGFDTSSDLQLMTVEFTVENLENKDLVLNSEFSLADSDANLASRTGTMFGFATKSRIKAHQTATMQDWFYTTDLKDRYLIWGRSFDRKFPVKWFKVLHGNSPKEDTE